LENNSTEGSEGKIWKAGFTARFPVVGFLCILAILASLGGIVVVLLDSDGKNVDTWCSTTVTVAGHTFTDTMNISSWISLLTWIMNQCLAVMLADAVAVS
jgi:hypothetical protein